LETTKKRIVDRAKLIHGLPGVMVNNVFALEVNQI
jgi:hypothetical protein